jgi:hypothetical protein
MSSNFGISNESSQLTITGRQTVPLLFKGATPVQRKGSIIFDQSTLKLYYSDGFQWVELIGSPSGNLVSIADADGNTSISTDTSPGTDSNIITFKTDGKDRAIFNPDGVFIVTGDGITNPNSIIPALGKVAHFEGDIDVTGVVDPIGVQFTEQSSVPGTTNNPGKGMVYVNDTTVGNFSNRLTFVDSSNVSHVLGDMISPVGSVVDNSIIRFDGTTGKLLKSSPIEISDIGAISNTNGDPIILDGNVSITQNLSVIGTTTTITSENLLINDNCIYLNNGNVSTTALPGCIVVNYLATSNFSNVAFDGFMPGVIFPAMNPSVVTDNNHIWVAGDIIQISGAANDSNNGLFEVESYSSSVLSITGIGGASPTFDFFQNQFVTDTTVAGIITQVNIAVLSSGPDGEWVIGTSGDNVTNITFTKVAVGTSLTTGGVGAGTISLVNQGTGPELKTKGIIAGSGLSIDDTSGTDVILTVDTDLTTGGVGAGTISLVNQGTGPELKTKGIIAGSGLSIDDTSGTDVILTVDTDLTTGGVGAGTISLVNQGTGPELKTKGIIAGSGLSIDDTSGTDVILTVDTDLTTGGVGAGTISLVNQGTGPELKTKGIIAGSGLSIDDTSGTDVILTVDTDLTTGGAVLGTISLVNQGTGPELKTKGIIAGSGLSIDDTSGTDVILTVDTDLTTGGAVLGTISLVNQGTGPELKTKGIIAGSGLSIDDTSGTDVILTVDTDLTTGGVGAGTISLVNQGTGPELKTKGIIAGSGLSIDDTSGTDVILTVDTDLTTGGAALGTISLVNQGTGPELKTKGIIGGPGLSIDDTSGTDVILTVDTNLTSGGIGAGTISLVNQGTGPNLKTRGVIAGTGITITSPSIYDIIITNSSPGGSSITLSNASGGILGQSIISDGTGPTLATYGIFGGNGIAISRPSNDIIISSSPKVYGQLTHISGGALFPSNPIPGTSTNIISSASFSFVNVSTSMDTVSTNMTSPSNGRLDKSGGPTNIVALVSFQLVFNSGPGHFTVAGIAKNNSLITNSTVQSQEAGAPSKSTIVGSYIVDMIGTDTIRLLIRSDNNPPNVEFYSYKLSVVQIFP